jgi:hypothetical protein
MLNILFIPTCTLKNENMNKGIELRHALIKITLDPILMSARAQVR